MTRTVEIEAPAKVNLVLEVLERRPDGFHEIDTLFQAVSLADVVRVTLGEEERGDLHGREDPTPARGAEQGAGAARGSGEVGQSAFPDAEGDGSVPWVRSAAPPIQLFIDGPDLGPLASNLAYRAARCFQELTGVRAPVRIELRKRIPVGAGLGGGSSDAAAVLKALAALTGFDDGAALHEVAAGLGSDIPFFLGDSALARGRGRGEVLTPLPPLPPAHLVLALPDVHVSTAEAYGALAAERAGAEGSDGRGASVRGGRDVEAMGGGLGRGRDDEGNEESRVAPSSWEDVARRARNDFEGVVVPRHDEIGQSLEALRRAGAEVALLSGSGAASFGLFAARAEAEEVAGQLSGEHPWRFVAVSTRTSLPGPEAVE